jgi:hypothetical protein
VKPSLDVKFKHYLARKIPHPYLDPMTSCAPGQASVATAR